MYASAMKFCGAMELCGIGYPTNEPIYSSWDDILAQVKAQKAGLLVAITRGHKPIEGEFMQEKGFAPVYQFTNPRTGTVATLWIKDFTLEGMPVTKFPDSIVTAQRGANEVVPSRAEVIPSRAACVEPDIARWVMGLTGRRLQIHDELPSAYCVDEGVILPYNGNIDAASPSASSGPDF